jgi:hypothetical protein
MSGTLKVGGKTLATHDTSANEISLHSDVMATNAQVQGIHTTANTAKATNANQLTSVTAVSGYNLADVSVGDYVTGEGIVVGTTVSAISGTTITLYHPDGDALSSSMTDLSGDPVSFYNSTKALSPGLVAGGLCRAWVNFYGSGTPTINAAYNVSSITYNVIGDYTINFATAMPDTKYSWIASAGFDNFAQQVWVSSPTSVALSTWKTIALIRLRAVYANNTVNSDPEEFNVAVFR